MSVENNGKEPAQTVRGVNMDAVFRGVLGYLTNPWVLTGVGLLIVYGAFKGLYCDKLPRSKKKSLLIRFSFYLLLVGCASIAFGWFLASKWLWGYPIVFWVVIVLLIFALIGLLKEGFKKSNTLLREQPLKASVLSLYGEYVVGLRRDFANSPPVPTSCQRIGKPVDVDQTFKHCGLDMPVHPGPRNHVICFDGTANDEETNTNVYQLYNLLAPRMADKSNGTISAWECKKIKAWPRTCWGTSTSVP